MQDASGLYTEISGIITNFEKSKLRKISAKEGIYYTPLSIALKMAADSLSCLITDSDLESILKLKILDPSCGAGIFLIACYEILIEKLKELNCNNYENRKNLLESCIFGADKDAPALEVAKRLLTDICLSGEVSSGPAFFSKNLINTNSFFCNKDFDLQNETERDFLIQNKIISWDKLFPGGVSLVIGNPPFGLGRDEKLSDIENQKLKKVYSKYKLGKVNKYMAFMARGYELLKEGGVLSYIVPNSWLGIHSAKGLRELFVSKGNIESIESFDKQIFPELEVECVIFRFIKGKKSSAIKLRQYPDASMHRKISESSYDAELCKKSPEFIIPLKWSDKSAFLRSHLDEHCIEMSSPDSPFVPMIALQAYSEGKGTPHQTSETVKKHLFHSSVRHNDSYFPYLEGKDIRRYEISWSGTYLHYGRHLAEPQELKRFSGRRILVREILNAPPYLLTACYTEKTYLYNKSVLHILGKENADEDDFYALLGILNSSLAGAIIGNFGRKSQRKLFPKLVCADLNSFPLPREFEASKREIIGLTMKACKYAGAKKEVNLFQNELDNSVLKVYRLTQNSLAL